MSNLFATTALIVPFDPAMDTPLGHKNLVLIYVVVGLAQLAYAAYALHMWRASARRRKNSSE